MNLHWWGWLLVSLASATVCGLATSISGKKERNSCLATFSVIGGGLIAIIAFIFALIGFLNWAWAR